MIYRFPSLSSSIDRKSYACSTNLINTHKFPAGALGPLPEPSVTIHLNDSEATVSCAANKLTFRIWLQRVNKQISESSVEIMKLSLLGDKREEQIEYNTLSKAKQPSDIFNELEKRHKTREAALQRFVYALKRLGNRRNGYVCVKEYKEIVGEHPPPKFAPPNKLESFDLCQCLADICVKIKREVSKALIQCCGDYLCSTTPENIPSLAFILTSMYQNKDITPQNQEKLAIALTVVKANECIKCIQYYRFRYKFPKLVINPDDVKDVTGKHI